MEQSSEEFGNEFHLIISPQNTIKAGERAIVTTVHAPESQVIHSISQNSDLRNFQQGNNDNYQEEDDVTSSAQE